MTEVVHKDFLGEELALNDRVVVTEKNYRNFVKARIIKFTPQKVVVGYRTSSGVDTYTVFPSEVIKITKKPDTQTKEV